MLLNVGPSHPASMGTIRNFVALEGGNITVVLQNGYFIGFEKSCENHIFSNYSLYR